MSWIFDHVPWWVWGLLLGGGGTAALVFIPGAFAFLSGIWAILPKPVKWALAGIGAIVAAFLAGRNRGSKDERDKQKDLADNAARNRTEIDQQTRDLTDDQVDKKLKDRGDFRD